MEQSGGEGGESGSKGGGGPGGGGPTPSPFFRGSLSRGASFESLDVSVMDGNASESERSERGAPRSASLTGAETPSLGSDSDGYAMRSSSMESMMRLGVHTKRQLAASKSGASDHHFFSHQDSTGKNLKCAICREKVGVNQNGTVFMPCDCSFPVCRPCYEYIREHEGGRCPNCHVLYRRMAGSPSVPSDPPVAGGEASLMGAVSRGSGEMSMRGRGVDAATAKDLMGGVSDRGGPGGPGGLSMGSMASQGVGGLSKRHGASDDAYGYGSWEEAQKHNLGSSSGGDGVGRGRGSGAGGQNAALSDDDLALSKIVYFPQSMILPYRLTIIFRFFVLLAFFRYRINNPNENAYWLWAISVACEMWFALSWILDQTPKWAPITRETFLDRLAARFERPGERSKLLPVDVFVSTADPEKEPPLVTMNVVLSVLAMDYPVDKIACYLSDDGAAMLTFEALTETASFARMWVPFCKKHEIEPRAPEMYFQQKFDYTKGKTQPDFIRDRRQVKRTYDEFKVRINALIAKSRTPPPEGWRMADCSPWPGNNRGDHVGMIQVFLQPDGDTKDVNNEPLPRLVYVSREKRPGYEHNKKAGAMNALMRSSALITNGPFILNLDCDHYVNNARAVREAMCYLMDPFVGAQTCFVQFPQRFDGVDRSDRYANHNTVFYDVNMKGLDGFQGPMYVGTGCVFRRQALYGFLPPVPKIGGDKRSCCCKYFCCCFSCCFGSSRKSRDMMDRRQQLMTAVIPGDQDDERMNLVPTTWHQQRFGSCANFVATVVDAEGSVPDVDPYQVLSDAILVISCGYEDDTEWGKSVGWMYGSVTEDIVTGFMMHVNGWRSIYAIPKRPAFKGSAPINLTDRLGQVLRWATGSVEIFFSRHNPITFHWMKHLMLPQRFAYVNTSVYPFTSIALIVYCFLPAVCLFFDEFIVADITDVAVLYFLGLFITIFMTAILELRWSGVALEEWWRNEQFWVIGGTSAHLAAVFQGMLKVLAGVDTSFTLTQKGSEDEEDEYAELYAFRFTWLMVPPTTIVLVNLLACFAGVSRTIYTSDNQNWGRLMGMTFFSFWVVSHLYPFVKGLMGKSNRTPTIVIVWSVLLAIILSLLWVHLIKD
ncbi:hypothetical protein CBR_g52173 [Chara braunii]|uniref:Cellulose synthase n=1 Tax=Chara braunii TaxID=69332 RepID=A0A388M9N9_CHABU|nr:hypothetical protein CBR_g52173 [Chara braunii]|eukprot:GBG91288.1 hypothetical protein CBR_g52173 [Chara braunii]